MSLGDRAWWAYHCLPRDADKELPATTALELAVKPPLSRGLIGKLHNGKQHTVEPEVGERLAAALGTTFDFLIRGIGRWPQPTGPVAERVVKWNGQTKLTPPERRRVAPPAMMVAEPSNLDDYGSGINEPMRQMAASKVHVTHPEIPKDEIDVAVAAVSRLRHTRTPTAETLARMAAHMLFLARGITPDDVVAGAMPGGVKRRRLKKKA